MPFEHTIDGLSEKAHDKAHELEFLVKDRIDVKDSGATDATLALARCWGNMTQAERNETAKAIDHDFNNHKWDSLPVPTVQFDKNGDCMSIYFQASKLDIHKNVKSVHVANDGETALMISTS